jgi:hypothetical protein
MTYQYTYKYGDKTHYIGIGKRINTENVDKELMQLIFNKNEKIVFDKEEQALITDNKITWSVL